MPPYGIDSLLNRDFDTQGYFTSPIEEIYDPAFGTLNFNRAYGPAPFTGNIPLTSYRVEPGFKYLSDIDGRVRDLGFTGDIDLPSFGGISGYRDTGGTKPILFMQPDGSIKSGIETVDKVQGFVEDDDLEAAAIPEFAEGQLKQSPTGIARLFEFLGNIPTPFNLVRRGLESLSQFTPSAPRYIGTDFFNPATGLNRFDRAALRGDIFGSSRTLKEYFEKKKAIRDARKIANRPGENNPDGSGGYTGGFDASTGNYNDPYDPGFAD